MIEFTGNWYIDMGTIGMLNLFRDYLPADQDKDLNSLLSLDRENLIRKFEYSFFRYHLSKSIEKNRKNKKSVFAKKLLDSMSIDHDAFENFGNVRKEVHSSEGLPISSGIYRTLWFFNTTDFETQKNQWKAIVGDSENVLDSINFDKTLNKLLPSQEKMGNAMFAKFNLAKVADSVVVLFALLSFETSSTDISRTNYFFYSPDLIFTYSVNTSIRKLVDRVKDKSTDILRITYQSIFDNLYKTRSDWALSNMLLISFKGLDNKGVKDFTTLNIGRFEAIVLSDEHLREKLNTSIDQGEKQPKSWLVRNLIEGESIFRRILRAARNDKYLSSSVLRAALSVELAKKELNRQKSTSAFNFKNLLSINNIKGEVPLAIKSHITEMNYASKNYYDAIKLGNQQNEMHYLLQIIQRQQQFKFINFTMNKLLTSANDKIEAKNRVTQYLFENVINKSNWEYYALGMIFKNFNQSATE